MTGFIASALLSRNRVSLKEAFEGLELCERKLSCTVLRGLDGSNPVRLLGKPPRTSSSFEQPLCLNLQVGRSVSCRRFVAVGASSRQGLPSPENAMCAQVIACADDCVVRSSIE